MGGREIKKTALPNAAGETGWGRRGKGVTTLASKTEMSNKGKVAESKKIPLAVGPGQMQTGEGNGGAVW